MGFRFQQRVRLFPGARLNFSRSGVSLTLGPRGAGVTLGGPGGPHANLGLPGSGLSWRGKIGGGGEAPSSAPDPVPPTSVLETEIASASPERLTSEGLVILRQWIIEAKSQRKELAHALAQAKRAAGWATFKLSLARFPLFRWMLGKKIPALDLAASAARQEVANLQTALEGSVVEADAELTPDALAAYEKLRTAFAGLCRAAVIWDLVAEQMVDRAATRSFADRSIRRKKVQFGKADLGLIKSKFAPLVLQNSNGGDFALYPGFLMILSGPSDFGLIDWRELTLRSSGVRFSEDEHIPPGAEVIGNTWRYVNKSGGPDRRFKDNPQIPVVSYGLLEFSSPSGLREEYMISSSAAAQAFGEAFLDYQAVVRRLGEAA